jgi:hypothetical protein
MFVVFLSYFSLIQNNLGIREIAISAMLIIINGQSCWLIFRRIGRYYQQVKNNGRNSAHFYNAGPDLND